MGGDGMNTREPLVGNLLRSLSLSDSPHNFGLCLRQDAGLALFFLLLIDDCFQRPLTDEARITAHRIKCIAQILQRTVFEDDAELVGGIDHPTQELRGQFVADEYPLRQRETFSDNQKLILIGKVTSPALSLTL